MIFERAPSASRGDWSDAARGTRDLGFGDPSDVALAIAHMVSDRGEESGGIPRPPRRTLRAPARVDDLPCRGVRQLWVELDPQVLKPIEDSARLVPEVVSAGREPDPGEPLQQNVESDAPFHAGERGTQA